MATDYTDEQLLEALSASVDANTYFLVTPDNIDQLLLELSSN